MQTKTELIYNDICMVCMIGFIFYRWNHDLRNFWIFLFVYFLIKQILAHKENYKLNKRLF